MRGRLGAVACVAAVSATLVCTAAQAAGRLQAGFVQQGPKLTASDEAKPSALGDAGGQFGHSVALSANGKTALVGGDGDNDGAGAAWVFTRTGSSWKQDGKKLLPTGNVGIAGFGESVALSADGKTALIGGSKFADGLGAAWVFVKSGSGWKQQARLLSSTAGGALAFGTSVALSGDGNLALVGGSFFSYRVGAAFLFRRTGSSWKQLGDALKGAGEVGNGGYGTAVALSADGSTAAVGGPYDGTGTHAVGAVWTYGIASSGWTSWGKKLVPSGVIQNDSFGQSIALSATGDVLLAGSNSGVARIFVRPGLGDAWQQEAKLTAAVPASAMFGYSVALSGAGTTVVVGAPYDGAGAGSSWAFSGSGGHWGQASKLASKGASGLDELGWGVGLSGDGKTAIVGGPNDAQGLGAAWVSTD